MTATTYPNWFAMGAIRYFEKHLTPLAGKPDLQFLQIGAFTGDATVWLLDNILTGDGSRLVDVDTWGGSDEAIHKTFDWEDVEKVYRARTTAAWHAGHLRSKKSTSADFFRELSDRAAHDFIYIDGGHTAFDVLNDAVAAYPVLKVGGLLAFDDYLWQSGKGDPHDPKLAVDAFHAVYQDRLRVVELGAQAWFRRVA